MKILAIDPGPTKSAYVIWDGERILEHDIIPSEDIIKTLEPGRYLSHCAIEMIACYGMAVGAEVFETCVWIGRFIERWNAYTGGLPLTRIPRKRVALNLCQSNRAKDANVRQSLIDRIGPPGRKKEPGPTFGIAGDEWAALGVAVTAWDELHAEAIVWQ